MNLKQLNYELTKVASFLLNNRKLFLFAVVFSVFIGLTFAGGTAPIQNLTNQIGIVCSAIKGLVPAVAFIMLILAGVIYAAGQVMGAETRARANVWSTAMLVGAIIGLLIVALAPTIITLFAAPGTTVTGCT